MRLKITRALLEDGPRCDKLVSQMGDRLNEIMDAEKPLQKKLDVLEARYQKASSFLSTLLACKVLWEMEKDGTLRGISGRPGAYLGGARDRRDR
jgi:hypothetical protein